MQIKFLKSVVTIKDKNSIRVIPKDHKDLWKIIGKKLREFLNKEE